MQPYFILVEGQRGPKVPHATKAEANQEAARLYEKNEGALRVFILETTEIIEPLPQ